jgi:hypothetical protein
MTHSMGISKMFVMCPCAAINPAAFVVECADRAGQAGAGTGRSGRAPVWSLIVDGNDVSRWFGEYASAFAACGRGERDTAALLAYYGVPLLLTTDDGFFALASGDQVVAAVQQQIDGMRAAGYARSEILDSEVSVLNSASALCRQTFSRHGSDGAEISRLTATYLVTDGPAGRRISVLAVHSR